MRADDLSRLSVALDGLAGLQGGGRLLADCHGRLGWPPRGVYFFTEPGELRCDTGQRPRVVRVGTHALSRNSKATLWSRLSQHRGTTAGTGNHRGSIFRLLVGEALQQQTGDEVETWGVGSSRGDAMRRTACSREELVANETPLEQAVSAHLGAMRVLVLEVDDVPGPNSLRGVIERNAIALLSDRRLRSPVGASPSWLGRSSLRSKVRESGLWNQNHVGEQYDPQFLDVLERLVRV